MTKEEFEFQKNEIFLEGYKTYIPEIFTIADLIQVEAPKIKLLYRALDITTPITVIKLELSNQYEIEKDPSVKPIWKIKTEITSQDLVLANIIIHWDEITSLALKIVNNKGAYDRNIQDKIYELTNKYNQEKDSYYHNWLDSLIKSIKVDQIIEFKGIDTYARHTKATEFKIKITEVKRVRCSYIVLTDPDNYRYNYKTVKYQKNANQYKNLPINDLLYHIDRLNRTVWEKSIKCIEDYSLDHLEYEDAVKKVFELNPIAASKMFRAHEICPEYFQDTLSLSTLGVI